MAAAIAAHHCAVRRAHDLARQPPDEGNDALRVALEKEETRTPQKLKKVRSKVKALARVVRDARKENSAQWATFQQAGYTVARSKESDAQPCDKSRGA